jgi:site-specific DNA-methyltransferase (cytosine-N4-specific)
MKLSADVAAVLENSRQSALVNGDAFDLLQTLPEESIDLILTSPPYWGFRAYEAEHNWEILKQWGGGKHAKESPSYEWYRKNGGVLGLEPMPEWYISNVTEILNHCQRALTPEGSLWLNLGDTYFARWASIRSKGRQGLNGSERHRRKTPMGSYRQEKQLLLIPSRVAISMQNHRWILRNDLIWYKPNVPPLTFDDRLRNTHEHFFHFVKRPKEGRPKYYYDVKEAGATPDDVQCVNAAPGQGQHSATFPEKLIAPRIRSSCPVGGVVLDPFSGVGTTVCVAIANRRRGIGFEVNRRFISVAQERSQEVTPNLY